MMGNHDELLAYYDPAQGKIVNDTLVNSQGMFWTRGYYWWMDSVYARIESTCAVGAYPGVRDFTRYRDIPFNFELNDGICGWDIGSLAGAWDPFMQVAFTAGPEGSPYRFLCLDFNSRKRDFPWPIGGGINTHAEITSLPFDNRAYQVTLTRIDQNYPTSCTLFFDANYQGRAVVVGTSGDILEYDERHISSVKLGENCAAVLLTALDDDKLRVTRSDPDLAVNGPVEWWLDEMAAHDVGIGPTKDKLIVFAHNVPAMGSGADEVAGFTLAWDGYPDAMIDYRDRIGAWFGGHVTPERIAWLLPTRTGQWLNVCPRFLCRPAGGSDAGDGHVTVVTLHYDPQNLSTPLVAESGVFPPTLDATTEDSAVFRIKMSDVGQFATTIRGAICRGEGELRCMVRDTSLSPNDSVVVDWDCRDSLGVLFLPGGYRSVFTGGGIPKGTSYFNVSGVRLSGPVSGVLDSFCDPAAITGNVTVPAGDTLIIQPGVRVMPAGDYKIQVYGTLIARGGEADSERILFTPYRRMKPVPDSCWPGFWKGIEVMPGGLCSLDNCVIEYAGGTPGVDSAAVFWHDAGTVVMTNSVVRQSSTRGACGDDENSLAAVLRGEISV
jgi:hypothetical protein